jgi:hypothetical protein
LGAVGLRYQSACVSFSFVHLSRALTPLHRLTCLVAKATGTGWEAAFEQASNFVSQLTLEEKVRLVTGTAGPCVGNIGPVARLGFNGLCLQDGPLAIREATYASVFPAGLTVAASWDRDLAHVRGQDMADEFVGKSEAYNAGRCLDTCC